MNDSANKPTVVKREMLRNDLIVKIKLPVDTQQLQTPQSKAYVGYKKWVGKGFFAHHMYGEPETRGNHRIVDARIWAKYMSDGTMHIYIDMHPAPEGAKPTHELKYFQHSIDVPEALLATGHACQGKYQGVVVAMPLAQE